MELADLGKQLLTTLAFTTLGLVIFALAFWLMEVIAPFSIRKEIEEDQNNALAIVMSSIVIGISLIIMGALLG
ncbi:MAG: DUF350 domain-containing protein [Proteobacteria bacterium]|nr:DUF350 domain-containing protein [Pseudomonadota bacterium]